MRAAASGRGKPKRLNWPPLESSPRRTRNASRLRAGRTVTRMWPGPGPTGRCVCGVSGGTSIVSPARRIRLVAVEADLHRAGDHLVRLGLPAVHVGGGDEALRAPDHVDLQVLPAGRLRRLAELEPQPDLGNLHHVARLHHRLLLRSLVAPPCARRPSPDHARSRPLPRGRTSSEDSSRFSPVERGPSRPTSRLSDHQDRGAADEHGGRAEPVEHGNGDERQDRPAQPAQRVRRADRGRAHARGEDLRLVDVEAVGEDVARRRDQEARDEDQPRRAGEAEHEAERGHRRARSRRSGACARSAPSSGIEIAEPSRVAEEDHRGVAERLDDVEALRARTSGASVPKP